MIICADDYGLHVSVNKAILDLCQKRKIAAVSVLVDKTNRFEATELAKCGVPGIKIGLHLDISIGKSFKLKSEVERQISKFRDLFGKFPDYIDGHRQCHIYPLVGVILLEVISLYERPPHFFIRSVAIHPELFLLANNFQSQIYLKFLNFLNKRFEKKMIGSRIKFNGNCWGVFNDHATVQEVFSAFATNGRDTDLFFFHPGSENIDSLDRKGEYNFALVKFK